MDYQSTTRLSVTRTLRLVLRIVALLFLCFGLLSCRELDWFFLKRSLRSKFSDVHWITTEQLADWLGNKNRAQPVLLDVRSSTEWKVSHLAGARRIDPNADGTTAAEGLAKDVPIVTYCSVGYRSGEMAERLRAAGYTQVQNLEGSIFAWANEGRPLVRERQVVRCVHPYNAVWGRLLKPELRALP